MIDFEKLASAGDALNELRITTNGTVWAEAQKNDVQIFISESVFYKLFNSDYKVAWSDTTEERLEHSISPVTKICTFRRKPHEQEDVIELLISKIDDLMERETNTERREGMYEAYHEILKVRG